MGSVKLDTPSYFILQWCNFRQPSSQFESLAMQENDQQKMSPAKDEASQGPAEGSSASNGSAPDDSAQNVARQGESKPERRKSRLRLFAMLALPLALVVGGAYVYVTGGRHIATEDSYVTQNQVTIRPEITGKITVIGTDENELVKEGQLLFSIDDSVYRNAVEQARAAVESARLKVQTLKSTYQKALAQRQTAQEALEIAQAQKNRHDILAKKGYISQATLDATTLTLQNNEGALRLADQDVASAKTALVGNPELPVDEHPSVMEALADLHEAELDLEHTRVYAPSSGIATQTSLLQKGQYVSPSNAVLMLVSDEDTWVEANYKETDLTHMQVGQTAEIEIDSYPSESIHGEVESIGAGTGSAFALIPAQNASGNWVKVVQRVPVRIKLETKDGMPALRLGMSAKVTVDTGHIRGMPEFVVGLIDHLGLPQPAFAAEPDTTASLKAADRQ